MAYAGHPCPPHRTHGIAYIGLDGGRAFDIGGDVFGDSGGVVADLEILRGDLVGIVRRPVGEDVETLYHDVITDVAEMRDGVEVSFLRAPARTFDLVVGADGVRSG